MKYNKDGITYLPEKGFAYQTVQNDVIVYDKDYFYKYVKYEGTKIAKDLNNGRFWFSNIYSSMSILDIGIGSGEFIKSYNYPIYGYDINPYAVKWLKNIYRYINPYEIIPRHISTITFWDSLEHIPNVGKLLDCLPYGIFILVSIPIFEDIEKITESKHFRPKEHLIYFTDCGFIDFMKCNELQLIEKLPDFEVKAGRDGIKSYVFRKV